MTDVLDGVRNYYRATGLTERPEIGTRWLWAGGSAAHTPATERPRSVPHQRARRDRQNSPKPTEITGRMSVLDVGSGIGGAERPFRGACGDRRGDRHSSGTEGRDRLEHFGGADFAIAITLGLITSPGPFPLIATDVLSIGAGAYPGVLTPAFVVPSSILLHALSLRQLRRRRWPETALR